MIKIPFFNVSHAYTLAKCVSKKKFLKTFVWFFCNVLLGGLLALVL
jgi:hypothetical protein